MGNTNRSATNPPVDPKIYFQNDLPKFIYRSTIGKGKFMKAYVMQADGVPLVVKVYMRSQDEDLQQLAVKMTYIWKVLSPSKYPFLLPYQCWIKSNSRLKFNAFPVYLIRQHLNSNLRDRLSTRPFLHEYEKLWMIFQLFKCIEVCHSHGVVHGDVKPENVLCTSWNWVVLTDLSPYKPTTIPDDDPTDFQYFFDGNGRNVCYVAPERFLTRISRGGSARTLGMPAVDEVQLPLPEPPTLSGQSFSGASKPAFSYRTTLRPSMDVFSLGCVMAEVFLDGEPLLDLPGMLKYIAAASSASSVGSGGTRAGCERLDQDDSRAKTVLQRIPNKLIRQVIIDMTQRDPDKRLTINQYRQILEGNFFDASASATDAVTSFADIAASSSSSSTPTSRPPQYSNPLQSLEDVAFPSYFDKVLHPLFLDLHWNGNTPDDRINILCKKYRELVLAITGEDDERGSSFFLYAVTCSDCQSASNTVSENVDNSNVDSSNGDSSAIEMADASQPQQDIRNSKASKGIRRQSMLAARKRQPSSNDETATIRELISEEKEKPTNTSPGLTLPLDELMNQCKALLEEIETAAGEQRTGISSKKSSAAALDQAAAGIMSEASRISSETAFSSAASDADAFFSLHEMDAMAKQRKIPNGLVIIVQVILSNFRHLKFPQSKVISLMLLARLGSKCSDDIILQRITPLLIHALQDEIIFVRVTALRSLRTVLTSVRTFSSFESNIFPQFIFPAIGVLARDPETLVRIAFAESIVRFAETAKRFLDRAHMMAQNKAVSEASDAGAGNGATGDDLITLDFSYDAKLSALHEQISRWIRELVVDSANDQRRGSGLSSNGSIVKRTLLVDVMRLCVFFGQESTMDMLLTQLLTFLNDQDWEMRFAFCANITKVCAFLGTVVTSECILPCIENAFVDVEERVICRALQSLNELAQQSLLTKVATVELVPNAVPLLLHPSQTIRTAVIELIGSAAASLNITDRIVLIAPILQPYLRYSIQGLDVNAELIKLAVMPPLSRRVYRRLLFEKQSASIQQSPGEASLQYSAIDVLKSSSDDSIRVGGVDDLVVVNSADSSSRSANVYLSPPARAKISSVLSELMQEGSEEVEKIKLLNRYLDMAARELTTKSIQWKNGVGAGLSVKGYVTILGRVLSQRELLSHTNLDSLLDISPSLMPEHAVQSLLIPSQKYGFNFFQPHKEELRCNAVENISTIKSFAKLRAYYGIISNRAEAMRILLNLGATDGGDVGAQGVAVGAGASTSNQNAAQLAAGQDYEQSAASAARYFAEAAQSARAIKRIQALRIPPLPPDLGTLMQPDGRKYNCYTENLDISVSADMALNRSTWRPKENVLVSTLVEHTNSVNRLAMSIDQTFFVSASADKTAKIWQVRGMDKAAFPRSAMTYTQHRGAVLDAIVIENTHSVATSSEDGTIHVWRVDLASNGTSTGQYLSSNPTVVNAADAFGPASIVSSGTATGQDASAGGDGNGFRYPGLSVSGYSIVKTIDPKEGSTIAMQHLNADVCSVLMYATQKGGIHGWDFRSVRESMHYKLPPELGYPTCMTLAPDRNWVCAGTDKGFIALWDIRFNVMSSLWRHSTASAIHRLACCKSYSSLSSTVSGQGQKELTIPYTEGAYLIVAAGNNEAAVWGLPEGGDCLKCFRSIPLSSSRSQLDPLPTLREITIPSHPLAPIVSVYESQIMPPKSVTQGKSVRAVVGRISQSSSSFLITAGTDRQIRFWDFVSPMKCFTVSGLEPAQPKPTYDVPVEAFQSKMFICYDTEVPSTSAILAAHIPTRDSRGPVAPTNNFKDTITDIKNIDLPLRMMVCSSKDGTIKLWK